MFSVSSLPCAELSEKAGKTKQIAGREEGGGLAGCCSVLSAGAAEQSEQPLKKKKIPNSSLQCFYLSLQLSLSIFTIPS